MVATVDKSMELLLRRLYNRNVKCINNFGTIRSWYFRISVALWSILGLVLPFHENEIIRIIQLAVRDCSKQGLIHARTHAV